MYHRQHTVDIDRRNLINQVRFIWSIISNMAIKMQCTENSFIEVCEQHYPYQKKLLKLGNRRNLYIKHRLTGGFHKSHSCPTALGPFYTRLEKVIQEMLLSILQKSIL